MAQLRPPRSTVYRSCTQAAQIGVPSGAAGCEWSIGSAARAVGAASEQGYHDDWQESHGSCDTLASVRLRPARCSMVTPIPSP